MLSIRAFKNSFASALTVGAFGLLLLGAAQAPQGGSVRSSTKASKSLMSGPITLTTIAHASLVQDYTAVQLRRFHDEQGNLVTVREQLQVDANGTTDPRFLLTFVNVVGQPPGSAIDNQWRQTYDRHAAEFVAHGSFRIRDLARASGNYVLHDFGSVVRAGRSARRLVVFPLASDKPVWVVDADEATAIPLFWAEFSDSMQVLSEVEAVAFTPSVQPFSIKSSKRAVVTPAASYSAADALMNSPTGLLEPDLSAMADYQVEKIEVRQDPLNARQQMVMSFTDGIDQFLVVQSTGSSDPFAGLPAATGGHVIARFRDPALSALVFHDNGVSFQISGRGSLQRLDELARQIYLQALAH